MIGAERDGLLGRRDGGNLFGRQFEDAHPALRGRDRAPTG